MTYGFSFWKPVSYCKGTGDLLLAIWSEKHYSTEQQDQLSWPGWASSPKKILSASKEEHQILERQFHMECQEPVLVISESDLTKLFYYGNRDPFLCDWFKICSLGVWTPDSTPHILHCNTNVFSATKAHYSHDNDDLMPSEGTGCASEFFPLLARQAPSLPRRLWW